jgi:Domain of unknown function (DUF932)
MSTAFFPTSTEIPNDLRRIEKLESTEIVDCGFGHTTRDEWIRDLDSGKIYDPREAKRLYIDEFYRATTSRYYTVIPDQRIEIVLKPFFDDGTFKTMTKEKTKNGLGTCWRLRSDRFFTIKQPTGGSHDVKDDIYQVGVIIRNSVNGGIALGGNVDTYRQICSNGLMGWRNEMSLRLFHYGAVQEKIQQFRTFVGKAAEFVDYIEQTLQAATQIEAKKELMQFIVTDTGITKDWLPDWLFTDDKQKYRVTGLRGVHTLYEAVNDITWKLTRSRRDHPEHHLVERELGFMQRNMFERNLGRSVEAVIVAKGEVPKSKRKARV